MLFFKNNEEVIQIIIQELAINKTVRTIFNKSILPEMLKVIRTIIEEGKNQGEFRQLPSEAMCIGFINLMLSPILSQTLLEGQVNEITNNQHKILFNIYIEGIKEKTLSEII
jgi:hypothetical protein